MAVFCFDFDGTLADTVSLEAVYYVDLCKKHGITVFQTIDDMKEACRGNYYDFCDDHHIDPAVLECISVEYHALLEEKNIAIPLFEGIPELLNELTAAGHRLYVVSMNDAECIRRCLAETGVGETEGVYGWRDCKNKVDTLKELLIRHDGEELYFISDTVGDMVEGAEAGVTHNIAVAYGWGVAEDLFATAAEIVFGTVAELGTFLKDIPV